MKKGLVVSGLNLAVRFSLVVSFSFIFTSCMKKPNMDPDYGPEVSLKTIEEALVSQAAMDPLKTMKLGQYVSIDETQGIDTEFPPKTLFQRFDKITHYKVLASDSENQPTQIELAYQIVLKERINDVAWKESVVTSMPLHWPPPAPSNNSFHSTRESVSEILKKTSLPMSVQALKAQDAASEVRITYHNFRREYGTVPIPDIVKSHPNCGGVLRCDLPLRTIQVYFDRIVWNSPERGTKTVFSFTYSPDIPSYVHDWDSPEGAYLTNQLNACARIFLEIQNGNQTQVVPILLCSKVVDFQF